MSRRTFSGGFALAGVVLGGVAERDGYAHAYLLAGLVTTAGVALLVASTLASRSTVRMVR